MYEIFCCCDIISSGHVMNWKRLFSIDRKVIKILVMLVCQSAYKSLWCVGNMTSVSSLNVILSVTYLTDLSSEQKKEMYTLLVESHIPRPPFPTGVDATNHECSERAVFIGRFLMFARSCCVSCCVSWLDFNANVILVVIWVTDSGVRRKAICRCVDLDSIHCLKNKIVHEGL